jgi:hypothetical protein
MPAMRLAIVFVAVLVFSMPANAQDIYLSRQKEALGVIQETVNSMCYTAKQDGQLVHGTASVSYQRLALSI